jgi:Zn-finger nucleic acid-binding protein
MESLSCPICKLPLVEAGRTQRCEKCDGAWITEDTVVALLEQRTASLVRLAWQDRPADQARPCAVCAQPMQMVNLGDVALDRCAQHGVWFDADELTVLFKQSKRFKTEPPVEPETRDTEHRGILGVFAKLFGR